MTEIEDIEFDLDIAKHNLWVAKTNLEDYQEQYDILNRKLVAAQAIEDTQALIKKDLLL